LETLAECDGLRLIGVGTQPDRPGGRRQHVAATPAGEAAAARGLAADKPASARDPAFHQRLRGLAPDLLVVIAYGQLLPPALLALPRHGCLNVHASLLPRHRGAAPIQAAILAGDAESGISFMQMDAGLDTGPLYRQVPVPLAADETAVTLQVRLARLAAAELPACIRDICRGALRAVPQAAQGITHARKIRKAEGLLDWGLPAVQLERQVRAFVPWPGSWFQLATAKGPRRIVVTAAAVAPVPPDQATPGLVYRADEEGLCIACGRDGLRLVRLTPEGRSEMTAGEFLRGCPVAPGSRLESEPAIFRTSA
jgi:methionyl-tRNA formyltransferase